MIIFKNFIKHMNTDKMPRCFPGEMCLLQELQSERPASRGHQLPDIVEGSYQKGKKLAIQVIPKLEVA